MMKKILLLSSILLTTTDSIAEDCDSTSEVLFRTGLATNEVRDLPLGSEIPNELFDKYTATEIGEMLVAQLHYQTKIPGENYEWLDAGVHVLFQIANIESIIKNGFLNRPTRWGLDSSSIPPMLKNEDSMIGYKLPKPVRHNEIDKRLLKIRPIYGFLNIANHPHLYMHMSYGNVFAVLKKGVRTRATYTAGDSLNLYSQNGNAGAQSLLQRKEAKTPTLDRDANRLYYEAQIWGGVEISDISYFMISKESVGMRDSDLGLLRSLDIPIFSGIPVRNNSGVVSFDRGPEY